VENQNTFIIYGCGGHARSVADVALSNGMSHLIFIDQNALENEKQFEFEVRSDFKDAHLFPCIVALGDNAERAKQFFELMKKAIRMTSVISHTAYLGKNARLGSGTFVGHTAHIGPNVSVGNACIINTRAILEHDTQVGDFSHISVNALLAGRCQIGDHVMIGAAATVIDKVKICSHVYVGAGSVVVQDITEPGVYAGVPAKKIKENQAPNITEKLL
jgi:UDP-N-acetylbacillosamine N-acetyltransferase